MESLNDRDEYFHNIKRRDCFRKEEKLKVIFIMDVCNVPFARCKFVLNFSCFCFNYLCCKEIPLLRRPIKGHEFNGQIVWSTV